MDATADAEFKVRVDASSRLAREPLLVPSGPNKRIDWAQKRREVVWVLRCESGVRRVGVGMAGRCNVPWGKLRRARVSVCVCVCACGNVLVGVLARLGQALRVASRRGEFWHGGRGSVSWRGRAGCCGVKRSFNIIAAWVFEIPLGDPSRGGMLLELFF